MEADDYTVYNWRTIEALLGNAEDKAAEGKWDDAYGYLEDALAINPEKATYTDLRDTLMGMYDNNGKTSASYIAEDYVGASYAVYSRSDYMTGTTPRGTNCSQVLQNINLNMIWTEMVRQNVIMAFMVLLMKFIVESAKVFASVRALLTMPTSF